MDEYKTEPHHNGKDTRESMFTDLRIHYRTGREYLIRGSGRNKEMGYRNGVKTHLGDLELSDWIGRIKALIEQYDEQEIYQIMLRNLFKICSSMRWSYIQCVFLTIQSGLTTSHGTEGFDLTHWMKVHSSGLRQNVATNRDKLQKNKSRERIRIAYTVRTVAGVAHIRNAHKNERRLHNECE